MTKKETHAHTSQTRVTACGSREVNVPVCMARRGDYLALLKEFKLNNHDSFATQPQISQDKATLTMPHMRAAAGEGAVVKATTRHAATLSSAEPGAAPVTAGRWKPPCYPATLLPCCPAALRPDLGPVGAVVNGQPSMHACTC